MTRKPLVIALEEHYLDAEVKAKSEGRTLDAGSIAAAAVAASEGTAPADTAIASGWYRREVIGVHLRRLLSGQE